MTRVSVRELQQSIERVLARVERRETIEVTRRQRPVARLNPVRQPGRPEPWPDLEPRARRLFGDRVIEPSPSEQVVADRGRW